VPRDAAALTGPRLRFVCVLSRRANTGATRELLSRVRYSDATEIRGSYGGCTFYTSIGPCWRAWRRSCSAVLVYFQVQGALWKSGFFATLVRLPWRLAIAVLMASRSTRQIQPSRLRERGGVSRSGAQKPSPRSCAAVTVFIVSQHDMLRPRSHFGVRFRPCVSSNASMTFASSVSRIRRGVCDISR